MPYVAYSPSSAQAAPAFTAGAPKTTGGMNLAQLRARLTRTLANRPDIATVDQDFFLNEAYRLMAQELDLAEFDASLELTLAADQPYYLLPANIDYIKDDAVVRDAAEYPRGGRVMVYSGLDQYRKLEDRSDRVSRLYRHGNMVVFWPTPNVVETVVLNVKFLPDPLTADNHVPLLPSKYHYALVVKAKAMALQEVREYIASAAATNEYLMILRSTTDTKAEESAQQHGGFYVARREEDLAQYNPEDPDAVY